jgi:hypothetical protein
MTTTGGGPLEVTDSDVDALAWQFLNSDGIHDGFRDCPLDRRLDAFLHHRGLGRLTEEGDIVGLIRNRVVTYASVLPRQPGQGVAAAERSHRRRTRIRARSRVEMPCVATGTSVPERQS